MRPDYCPQANEPCQAMCEKPCAPIGRLKVEKLEPLSEDEVYILVGNRADIGDAKTLVRAVEAAHNAKMGGAR